MPSIRMRSHRGDDQADVGRFALLLVIVLLLIGALALVGLPRQSDDAGVLERILLTLLAGAVMVATLRVARVSRQSRRWFGTAVAGFLMLAIVGFLVTSNPLFRNVVSFAWVLLVLAAPALILRQVLASDRVTIQTILGAITVYLMLGVSLALLAIAMQGAAGFFEAAPRPTAYVYFAFVTITTLGYGDLAPYTDAARLVSVMAAVIAQMYLVIVVARLVSIWRPAIDTKAPGIDQ